MKFLSIRLIFVLRFYIFAYHIPNRLFYCNVSPFEIQYYFYLHFIFYFAILHFSWEIFEEFENHAYFSL